MTTSNPKRKSLVCLFFFLVTASCGSGNADDSAPVSIAPFKHPVFDAPRRRLVWLEKEGDAHACFCAADVSEKGEISHVIRSDQKLFRHSVVFVIREVDGFVIACDSTHDEIHVFDDKLRSVGKLKIPQIVEPTKANGILLHADTGIAAILCDSPGEILILDVREKTMPKVTQAFFDERTVIFEDGGPKHRIEKTALRIEFPEVGLAMQKAGWFLVWQSFEGEPFLLKIGKEDRSVEYERRIQSFPGNFYVPGDVIASNDESQIFIICPKGSVGRYLVDASRSSIRAADCRTIYTDEEATANLRSVRFVDPTTLAVANSLRGAVQFLDTSDPGKMVLKRDLKLDEADATRYLTDALPLPGSKALLSFYKGPAKVVDLKSLDK